MSVSGFLEATRSASDACPTSVSAPLGNGTREVATRTQVSVVIPAYNEEHGVEEVVRHIGEVLQQADVEYEIIIIDDGSTDKTAAAARNTPATVIEHGCNRGYGAALKTGIRAAKYDLICIMDADGTYPAEQLPVLIAESKDADMVVGARTKGAVQIPFVRRPAKWVLNRLADFMTGTKIPDLNSGMRIMRRGFVLDYMDILPDRFSFTTTITLCGLCDGYRVKFLPVEYFRRVGRSKIKPTDALNFLILILRTMTYFRPLRIFVPTALALLAVGVTKFIIDFFYMRLSGTSVLFCLASLNTLSIGIIADMLCFVRRRRAVTLQ
jgi:glycosyltransferase involved in cell wall biosynthesis